MNKLNYLKIFYLILIMSISVYTFAEGAGSNKNQIDFEQMKEILKDSGMTPEQMKQYESMMGGINEQAAEQQAAQLVKDQQKFKATYGENPIAQLNINNKSYTLRVTECKKYDNGTFRMNAEQPPGEDNVELNVACCRKMSAGQGSIIAPEVETDGIPPTGNFDGKTYTWEGNPELAPEVYVKINLSCEGLL